MSCSTIVSAFYLTSTLKHTRNEYIIWLNNFLGSIDSNLIFFCEENILKLLKNMRKKFLHRTLFIILPRNEFVAYSKFGLNFWMEQNNIDREKSIHSYELYAIWYEKKEFIQRAIKLNPFNTETFIWCDAGAFRNQSVLNELKYFGNDDSNIPKDKIVLLLINQYINEDKEQIKNDTLIKKFDYLDKIGAGIQAAYINTWNIWSTIYDKKVQERINNCMFIGKEQTIMSIISLENPEIVKLIQPRYDIYDHWFTLLYYFLPIKEPLISILIPIYNGIEFIEESINSVKNQSYSNWEVLIGVNGWEPNSDVYKKAITYTTNNIHIYDLPKNIKGKSAALNELVKVSNGNWIGILDVDDIWHRDKLQIQVNHLNNTGNIYDVIGTQCLYFGSLSGSPSIPFGDITNIDFFKVNPLLNSSCLIRKKYSFWNTENLGGVEDYELWLRLRYESHAKIFNIDKILMYHRIHPKSHFNNHTHNFLPQFLLNIKNEFKSKNILF